MVSQMSDRNEVERYGDSRTFFHQQHWLHVNPRIRRIILRITQQLLLLIPQALPAHLSVPLI